MIELYVHIWLKWN